MTAQSAVEQRVEQPALSRPDPPPDSPPDSTADRPLPVTPWPRWCWPVHPVRVRAPRWGDTFTLRLLIVLAAAATTGFLVWLLQPQHVGDLWLYAPLTLALALVIVGWLFEWLYYAQIAAPPVQHPQRDYTVDVLTTACPGEPREMIVRTLLAMQAIEYPHRSILCDEGNDPQLKAVCEQLGVLHVTRTDKRDAKAGNINNALRQTDGEICIILDPDHEPSPYMLDRVLAPFDDPKVGFVQSVQAYRNQGDSLIARGAAEMSYHFYGPIMMGMHGFGTVQSIGANCAFRRTALESIGGHAPGLAEDMHTAMRLYDKGWRGMYVPEALTRGLVPSTLGAFYKQQIKWSCGVFDLLFQVYPRVFRGMTGSQRLHFLLAPTYFLRGLVTLIGLAVPILCLLTGAIAWRINLDEFLLWSLPMLGMVTLVRMAAQRFVLEPSERGMHVMGGLLSVGSWWVFLLGNLCALFRVKVPYIPTPKEDVAADEWKLAAPNFIVAALCVLAIGYGLHHDYTPFSLMMATLAGFNAAVLVFIGMLGQRQTLARLAVNAKQSILVREARDGVGRIRQMAGFSRRAALATMREWTLGVALVVLAATVAVHLLPIMAPPAPLTTQLQLTRKSSGGFYTGVYVPTPRFDELPGAVRQVEQTLGADMQIVSLYIAWAPWSIEHFPTDTLRTICRDGGVPMITWEPWTSQFPQAGSDPDLAANRKVFAKVLSGVFDDYIVAFATKLRDVGEPVLLRFAHEPDNPQYPWSATGGNTPDEFAAAWRYVADIFSQMGASNVGWVYSPWSSASVERFDPGPGYVDWVGLTVLNYGQAGSDGKWRSFDELYEPFRPKLAAMGVPVMIAEFGSTPYGGNQQGWLTHALGQIASDYPEIEALVFFHSDQDRNWVTSWRPSADTTMIDWTFGAAPQTAKAVRAALDQDRFASHASAALPEDRPLWGHVARPAKRSTAISGSPGQFELTVDGESFFVRGVAFNSGGDWRNGNLPPTRRQLDADFRQIRDMGANTIRRYGQTIYDHNILAAASDYELKVLYGFWFDQELDYVTQQAQLDEYERQVIAVVQQYRNHPAILGWSLGNEVWGLLAHKYNQPYLTHVRHAYVRFIDRLARRIREIDSVHPIITVHEHNHLLPGAIHDFALGAPTLDATGINSYYEQNIGQLAHTMHLFDRERPYLITEYGPDGYWHRDFTATDPAGELVEASAIEKGQLYRRRWMQYIEAARGMDLGGVAFCWRDRYEGTSSWFGLTTPDGQRKPAYFALRELWTGMPAPHGPAIVSLDASTITAQPGQRVTFTAHTATSDDATATYAWQLVDDLYRPIRTLTPDRDGQEVTMKLPSAPGLYRVHVQVQQGGAMDERSCAIRVGQPTDTPSQLARAKVELLPGQVQLRLNVLDGR